MAVVFTVGTASEATASVTSATVTLPASLAANDYVFLFCTLNGSSGSITAPAGYSTLFPSTGSVVSTSHVVAIFYRLWQSGDGNPVVACTSGRLAVLPARVRGSNITNPLDGSIASTSPATSGTTIDAPALTSSTSTLLVTMHSGRSSTGGDIISFTPAAGMTELGEAKGQSTSQTNAALSVSTLIITGGSTTGIKTATADATLSGSRGVSFLAAASVGAPVGITRATTWKTIASVGATRATTWTTRESVVGFAQSTSWTVITSLVTVAITRATAWSQIGRIVVTRATTWRTRKVIVDIQATTWADLTLVELTRGTTWTDFSNIATTASAIPGARLRVYLPNGADQGRIPTPTGASVSYPLNDVGALTFDYLVRAPRAALLGQPCEVAVEFSPDGGVTWSEPDNSRFIYTADGGNPLDPADSYAVTCRSYISRLSTAPILPKGLLDLEGKRTFVGKTPGVILKTFLNEAQADGFLTGISHASFSTTLDSAGVAWGSSMTVGYEPGLSVLGILQNLADQGFVDYKMNGRSLFVYKAGTALQVDRTIGATPVTLRAGRDLTEASYQRTWENVANYAFFQGDNVTYEYTNPAAVVPWGKQGVFISNGSVSDAGTMAVLTQAELAQRDNARTEYTRGFNFSRSALGPSGTPRPFFEYQVGDFINSAIDGNAPIKLRVRQLTLALDNHGLVSGNAVLNDRFLEADVRAKRRVEGITNGAQAGPGTGGTTPPPVLDKVPPAQVSGLFGSSSAYMSPGGFPSAQVTLSWTPTAVNADGTPMDDLDHYEIFQRTLGQFIDLARFVQTTTDTTVDLSPYTVGSNWVFNVLAVDTLGNRGLKSNDVNIGMATDTIAPQAPSTPIVTTRLGIVAIYWDGAPATGTWPEDFAYIEVHSSTVNSFTPTTATLSDVLYGEGTAIVTGGAYGVPIYAKFIAVDKTPLKSAPSAQGSAAPAQLVNADLITNIVDTRLLADGAVDTAAIQSLAVGTANIKDANVVTAKIADLAVNSAKISALDVGKLTAGTMTADVLVANRLTTASSGSRVQMDSTGIRMFKGSATTPTVFLDPTPGQLRIYNTSDASHTSTGHGIQFGLDNAENIIIDNNEIMARFNGSYGTIAINREGGSVSIGGIVGGWPQIPEPDSTYGNTPADEDHLITLRGTVYLPTDRHGYYDDEYAPLMIGRRGSSHLYFGVDSFGASSADAPSNIYIQPMVQGGGMHNTAIVMASQTMAIRRLGANNAALYGWGNSDGNVGSAVQFWSSQVLCRTSGVTGYVPSIASAFTVGSEQRLKKDIVDFDPLDTISKAPGKKWKYLDSFEEGDHTHFGPMLEQLPPEMVRTIGDDEAKGYDVAALVGVLWEAVRVLTLRLEAQEKKK